MSNEDPWIWCLSCERCYKLDVARRRAHNISSKGHTMSHQDSSGERLSILKCTYPDCGASYLTKGLLWSTLRKDFPERPFPEVPARSIYYPLESSVAPYHKDDISLPVRSINSEETRLTVCIRCSRLLKSSEGPLCAQCKVQLRPPNISKRRQEWWDD